MSDSLDLTADTDEQLQTGDESQTQTQSQSQSQDVDLGGAAAEEGHVDVYSSQQALAPIRIRLNKVAAPPSAAASAASSTAAVAATSAAAASAAVAAAMPSLHLLPCRIAHTGPASIPNYFQPERSDASKTMLTYGADGSVVQQLDAELFDARFRGRQLTGSILTLPSTARGFIFEEDEESAAVERTRSEQTIEIDAEPEQQNDATGSNKAAAARAPQTLWKTSSTFNNLMLWQPDQELFERKHIREAIEEWIPIAHAIHDPLV